MNIIQDNNMVSVSLPGLFEAKKVKEFNILTKDALAKGCTEFIVDFYQTTFIDSSGIGSLVSLAKDLKEKEGNLSLSNICGNIQELFEDTGFDKLFNIKTDNGIQDAAIDIFNTSVDIRLNIVEEIRDDICILHMSGVMNHPAGSHYFKQKFLLSLAHSKKIFLDFEELTFFDSLSIGILFNMSKLAKETGCSLRLGGSNFIVNDLLSTLGVEKIIPCFDTISDAIIDWK